jgi:cytoskeletal protein RodZ
MQKIKLSQSGFAVLQMVLILIVVAIVGFAGWYVYKANKDTNSTLNNLDNSELSYPETTSSPEQMPNNDLTSNIIDVNEAKVGDQVANMKIVSIGALNSSGPFSDNNVKVVFSGQAEIDINYEYNPNNLVGGPNLSFLPSEDSVKYLPIIKGDERTRKYFNNEEAAISLLGLSKKELQSGSASVTIQDYIIQKAPASIWDTMTLVKVD